MIPEEKGMDQTVAAIESQIDHTRERLDSDFEELAQKFDRATDWREHVRARPLAFLGAAFAGGVVLAAATRGAGGRYMAGEPLAADIGMPSRWEAQKRQASEVWDNVTGALIGLAIAKFRQSLSELIPDFDEHYRRAEQRSRTSSH
jgi:hypothetical protein